MTIDTDIAVWLWSEDVPQSIRVSWADSDQYDRADSCASSLSRTHFRKRHSAQAN
jgi:hypothetical protein